MAGRMKRHFEYGFTIIENRVFQSTAFDQLTDKFLYMTLIKFSFGKDSAFPSIATLAKHCLCAKNTIKNALKRLEQRGYIKKENRVDEKGAHLSNIYHLFDIASNTLPESRSISESTVEQSLPDCQSMNDLPVALSLPEGQPTNDPPVRQSLTPKNKDLEEYKVKNKKEYRRIIDYLNQKADKTYKASTRKTQSLIHARLSEGFCFDDFKSVIDKKCKQWLNDPKMSRYVRPATLFGTKFEDYLNEPEMYDGSATFTHDLAERWLRRDDENGSL